MSFYALKTSGAAGFDTRRVSQSVKMNGTDEYFTRANTSHSTNRAIGIISYRLEDDDTASKGLIGIGSASTGSTNAGLYITNNTLTLYVNGTGYSGPVVRNNEWNHAVVSFDLSEASAADKGKVYHRGELVIENGKDSSFGSTTNTYAGEIFTGNRSPGKMAQITWLDGVSIQNGDYAITDFGDFQTAGENGTIFTPKSDANMAAIAAAVGGNSWCLTDGIGDGVDASGNGNTVTATNITHTDNGSDDSPSFNLAVLNHLTFSSSQMVLLDAGHKFEVSSSTYFTTLTEVRSSGKWYQEFIATQSGSGSVGYFGICPPTDTGLNAALGTSQGHLVRGLTSFTGIEHNGSTGSFSIGYANNDKLMFAIDLDNGWLFFGKNGTWYDSAGSTHTDLTTSSNAIVTGLTGDWAFACGGSKSSDTPGGEVREPSNFEHQPSGFEAMTSANRPDPEYQGADWLFSTVHPADGTASVITGLGGQGDLMYGKGMNFNEKPTWIDSVRGVDKHIFSSGTQAEVTAAGLASFDADGITLSVGIGDGVINQSGFNFIYHIFKAGGAAVTNNDGTITSQVSAASAGHLSIISTTGNATDNTAIGHGLPGTPELVIAKNRTDLASWATWHINLSGVTYAMDFNNGTTETNNPAKYGGTGANAPNATTFTVGTNNQTNGSGDNMIYYAFRSVEGLCKVGTYTTNNNADGPYVHVGFRPRWLMFKDDSNWVIFDTERDPVNPVSEALYADTTNTEVTFASGGIDILSSGFKHRQTSGQMNTTAGSTVLFVAIADVAGGGPNLPPILGI